MEMTALPCSSRVANANGTRETNEKERAEGQARARNECRVQPFSSLRFPRARPESGWLSKNH